MQRHFDPIPGSSLPRSTSRVPNHAPVIGQELQVAELCGIKPPDAEPRSPNVLVGFLSRAEKE